MSDIKALVNDFLSQKKIAFVGVSDRRETGCNLSYRKFKTAGYTVSAVNPRLSSFDGDSCYPDLKSIPELPDAVFILTNPSISEQIVQECVELGIRRVWMHCMLGTKPGLGANMTSVSPNAVRLCHENNITVIPGSCPNQFLNPDFGHAAMRWLFAAVGNLKVD